MKSYSTTEGKERALLRVQSRIVAEADLLARNPERIMFEAHRMQRMLNRYDGPNWNNYNNFLNAVEATVRENYNIRKKKS